MANSLPEGVTAALDDVAVSVVRFEEDRVITWCYLDGHGWRWGLEPASERT